mgnify:CR=1 FL=1
MTLKLPKIIGHRGVISSEPGYPYQNSIEAYKIALDRMNGFETDACLNADVITTLTPSKQGFLGQSHIKRPVHINAIGADAEGKRELERSIWMKCDLIVDDYEQASHSGEAQYVKDLTYLTLGDQVK